ncbi:GDSL family lipase [Massilia forsythiae]|uniref:GDSL family lipase n=1 Tax=Massilia forsythiae TaxID=2728020 RepID=A0A7Z2VZK3_9BURK|nr:GDSL-type esterase/lipase family protein [Massilia forsythiae]QJE02058.1 GDSL family lipase [Massilia forsythiae]
MKPAFRNSLLLALALAAGPFHAHAAADKPNASQALEKKDDGTFLKKHEAILARARSGPIGLLFLGDSITERWHIAPHIWDAYYGKYQPANFGIGGDRTGHVIWRIEHGELDGIAPKLVVFMLGTNNSGDYPAEEIAAADRKIVGMIRAKLPAAKILVLGIFPRGPRDTTGKPVTDAGIEDAARRMRTIDAVNRDLVQLDNGRDIRFLNINATFLGQDGKIPNTIMPDQLHPGPAGYQLWADAMQPLLQEMLK